MRVTNWQGPGHLTVPVTSALLAAASTAMMKGARAVALPLDILWCRTMFA